LAQPGHIFWKDAVDEALVKVFIESYESAPAEIILDLDSTARPLYGKQEGRFFHGYCYLPLYIFAKSRSCAHDCAKPNRL